MLQSRRQTSRVLRSKEEARANYDKTSRRYDLLAARIEPRCRNTRLQKLKAKEADTILEVAAEAIEHTEAMRSCAKMLPQ